MRTPSYAEQKREYSPDPGGASQSYGSYQLESL